jgi:hypothetical protein
MKKYQRIAAVIAFCGLLPLTMAAYCDNSKSSGGSNSGSGGGDCGYSWNPCGSSAPSPKVDAEPQPSLPPHIDLLTGGEYDCNVFLESASGLIAGGNMVDADAFGYCHGTPPAGISFKLSIWTFNVTHRIWFEAPESIRTFHGSPLPFPDSSHYATTAYCVPGQYKIYMAMFHNGVKLIENYGPTIRFSQSQCSN